MFSSERALVSGNGKHVEDTVGNLDISLEQRSSGGNGDMTETAAKAIQRVFDKASATKHHDTAYEVDRIVHKPFGQIDKILANRAGLHRHRKWTARSSAEGGWCLVLTAI